MGRIYTVRPAATITLAEARDVFEVLASTNKPIKVWGWHLFQKSDVKDAEEEILEVETVRGVGTVTSGSGGSTPTAQPTDDNDTPTPPTVEANNTTRMAVGTGTLETLEWYGWNIRIPWTHFFTPELRPRINPADRWTLAIPVAPADGLTFGSLLWLEEL